MRTRDETRTDIAMRTPVAARQAAYTVISVVAALTSVGIWLLMIVDEERSVGAATLEMAVKFTNVTVVLVGVVAAWIALDAAPSPARAIAHLTVMVMAVVTAIVNAVLLDPTLPSGWWGVVDLSQHYAIPVAVVAAWATLGPPAEVPASSSGWVVVVPFAWLMFVLARGMVTESYPYDFLDAAEHGWVRVVATVSALFVAMLAIGASISTVDRRRSHDARSS